MLSYSDLMDDLFDDDIDWYEDRWYDEDDFDDDDADEYEYEYVDNDEAWFE